MSSSAPTKGKKAGKELSECMLSQFRFTVGAVVGTTGYALMTRPKNGLGLLLVVGSVGSMCDLVYGYTVACKSQAKEWEKERQLDRERKL
ncbi:hypothetical protein ACA910_022691 [Epithemia clementina (nom. ined.)]